MTEYLEALGPETQRMADAAESFPAAEVKGQNSLHVEKKQRKMLKKPAAAPSTAFTSQSAKMKILSLVIGRGGQLSRGHSALMYNVNPKKTGIQFISMQFTITVFCVCIYESWVWMLSVLWRQFLQS